MNGLMHIDMYHFLILAILLFMTGIFGVVISKHLIKVLISLEIMFCGITLSLATFTTYCDPDHTKGTVAALFFIVLSAIHIAIGMAITMNIFKFKETVNIENIGELKG